MIDTTILVSGFGWHGMPGQIVDAALEGRFISITSDALLDELSRSDSLAGPERALLIATASGRRSPCAPE